MAPGRARRRWRRPTAPSLTQWPPGASPSPLIIVGPARYGTGDNAGVVGSTNLSVDAVKGTNTVAVVSTAGFSAGQIILLDEASGAGWQTDPLGRGQIWASNDWRVVWQKHNPTLQPGDTSRTASFRARLAALGSGSRD